MNHVRDLDALPEVLALEHDDGVLDVIPLVEEATQPRESLEVLPVAQTAVPTPPIEALPADQTQSLAVDEPSSPPLPPLPALPPEPPLLPPALPPLPANPDPPLPPAPPVSSGTSRPTLPPQAASTTHTTSTPNRRLAIAMSLEPTPITRPGPDRKAARSAPCQRRNRGVFCGAIDQHR